ncbi:hypothetical protein [Erwinia persicina]|uniref:hypothetical protein n=1 Tax=Erwinia persicina TaxID=55211 RepID=UPI0017830DEE|nr:hypothetical protein [Erwinia persicina]MBD8164394.1 hypothetical protein [Erwinia persicina]MBD8216180.1 hypothetical protein [Erwinia persicina]
MAWGPVAGEERDGNKHDERCRDTNGTVAQSEKPEERDAEGALSVAQKIKSHRARLATRSALRGLTNSYCHQRHDDSKRNKNSQFHKNLLSGVCPEIIIFL